MTDAIQSPCILVCSIDMATGYCHGCGRTRDEIGGWTLYTPAQRQTIMQDLPARVETIAKRPRRETRRRRMAQSKAQDGA